MRSFIAIDLPAGIQAELAHWQGRFRAASAKSASDIRWTRVEGIHLTLKFLGEISMPQVEQVTDALAALERTEPFSVEVRGFGFFPDARRPRVFWAGVVAPPALGQLAARVESAMKKLGFPTEARTFSPHLTLARLNSPRPQAVLTPLLEAHGRPSLGVFEVSEFFLFESKLSPHGAEYRKVARFSLT